MEMTNDELKGKWKQLKGSAQAQWGKLTDDDLDWVEGRREQLIGKIQERYGKDREAAREEVDTWLRKA